MPSDPAELGGLDMSPFLKIDIARLRFQSSAVPNLYVWYFVLGWGFLIFELLYCPSDTCSSVFRICSCVVVFWLVSSGCSSSSSMKRSKRYFSHISCEIVFNYSVYACFFLFPLVVSRFISLSHTYPFLFRC